MYVLCEVDVMPVTYNLTDFVRKTYVRFYNIIAVLLEKPCYSRYCGKTKNKTQNTRGQHIEEVN